MYQTSCTLMNACRVEDWQGLEYQKVSVEGMFDHDQYVAVGML